jgi:hypothetical protein
MTCEEWDRLFDRDPQKCTRAERMAFVSHSNSCAVCRKKVEDFRAGLVEHGGIDVYSKADADRVAKKLIDQDQQDPEYHR